MNVNRARDLSLRAYGRARYIAERVVLRTKDVRQTIQVAKLCDSPEEVGRVEVGV